MNDVEIAQAVSMVVLSVAPMLLGMLPRVLVRRFKLPVLGMETSEKMRNILSGFLCFGGGVLMATAFVHLLPDVHDGMAKQGLDTVVPLAELICCLGFFFIYFIEEMVHRFSDRQWRKKQSTQSDAVSSRKNSESSTKNEAHIAMEDFTHIAVGKDHSEDEDHAHEDHHHSHHAPQSASLNGFLIVLGLSLHSVFEGLAIGLEDTPLDVWKLMAAVASHKLVLSACVGLEMTVSGMSFWLHMAYMFVYSFVTPLGIGVGMFISNGNENADADTITALVLQSVAAGTMIYVAFFEVLERERAKLMTNRMLQWSTTLLGFLLMTGLDNLLSDELPGDDDNVTTVATVY